MRRTNNLDGRKPSVGWERQRLQTPLTGNQAQMKLAALKECACIGRGRREFKSPAELRAHVIQALSDLKQRELESNSPTDAIRAEEQRLHLLVGVRVSEIVKEV